jgi:hypothetical protein
MSPVRGEKAEGSQSFVPDAVGQMSRTVCPSFVSFSGLRMGRPVFRSIPLVELTGPYASADSTSPVARSIT